jgi:uncharacterized membrane protein YgdD (TMEM256/DUF423 family)
MAHGWRMGSARGFLGKIQMTFLSRIFMAFGGLFALIWVGLSAAVGHGLGASVDPSALAASLAQHQFHALGLIVVGLALNHRPSRWLVAAGALMLVGLFLFCLNIDARVLLGWEATRAWVPVGGSAFMLGWLCFCVGLLKPEGAPPHD